MNFNAKKMNEDYAKEILLWKYEAPYDLYNNECNDEGVNELLNGDYVAVVNEIDELVGFCCIGASAQVPIGNRFGAYAEDMVDIGLGMKPNLTGKGHGIEFFSFILRFVHESQERNLPLRLTVATFNNRAIHLYNKLGFIENVTFYSNEIEFTTMIKEM
ncbi:GNAT family N-acetyltransferase [Bacillus sp. CGMCC 1.16607]|uniref:GNAT family N-acetyltransferase n=1 Tax=Bacillus sp. CGMCC 1.16607 TaxID=3351842 RepID=UPI00362D7062